jgi:hypothetical protein
MHNPIAIFLLGMACGAGIIVFGWLALWMRRKDVSMTPLQQMRNFEFYGKGVLVMGLWCLSCIVWAGIGTYFFSWVWLAGVLVGIGTMLALRWLRESGKKTSHVS